MRDCPTRRRRHLEISQEIAAWQACVGTRGLQYCVRHYNPQQLVKGMYSEFITVGVICVRPPRLPTESAPVNEPRVNLLVPHLYSAAYQPYRARL